MRQHESGCHRVEAAVGMRQPGGLANTLVRAPAGWLVDRTARSMPYAVAGVVAASAGLALVPQVERFATLVALATVFGGISGIAFVAISVMLAGSATPATRGAVMGGYSTSLYLGLALGSFALGPVITHCGDAVGFAMGAIAGVISTVIAARLWVGDAAERAAEWKVESINSASDVIWPVVTPVACASAAGWNSDLGCQ